MRVIAFAGPVGSGKSEVAQRVAAHLGVKCLSFGDVVRQEATLRSIPTERQALAALGRDMIAEAGEEHLLERLLGTIHSAECVVLDGVRSVKMVQAIRDRSSVETIYFTADIATRLDRLRRRGRFGDVANAEQLAASDQDPLEIAAREVAEVASCVIDTTGVTAGDVVMHVLEFLRR